MKQTVGSQGALQAKVTTYKLHSTYIKANFFVALYIIVTILISKNKVQREYPLHKKGGPIKTIIATYSTDQTILNQYWAICIFLGQSSSLLAVLIHLTRIVCPIVGSMFTP